MTIPKLEQNWYSRGNIPFPNESTEKLQGKSWLWLFKELLKGTCTTGTTASVVSDVRGNVARPAGSCWTVEGSNDGLGNWGLDGTDRWTSLTNMVASDTAATNYAWIVLKSPAALGPVYLCISLRSPVVVPGGTYDAAGFFLSLTPFTGGGAQVRPISGTVTGALSGDQEWTLPVGAVGLDQMNIFTNAFRLPANVRVHFTVNTNGGFHMVSGNLGDGFCENYISIEKAVEIDPLDLCPVWFSQQYLNATETPQWQSLSSSRYSSRSFDNYSPSAGSTCNWVFGQSGQSAGGNAKADRATTNFNLLPVYLHDSINGSMDAWRGRIPDIWVVGAAPSGFAYPTAVAPKQCCIGDLLLPLSVWPDL